MQQRARSLNQNFTELKNWLIVELKLTTSQLKSVQEYCKLNNIEDVDDFISKCFTNGLNIEKYGLLGDNSGKTGIVSEKQVEIEVIREIRVEVPVEVVKYVEVPVEIIKEVEVIQYVDREVVKEVPVEIIKEKIVNVIQEVPVPIIGEIGDETQINELLLKIQQLENRPPEIVEVEKIVEIEKEVEKIVEVIKEVVVEKTTTDNSKQKALEETIQKIRTELQLKNKEINDLKNTITEIQTSNGRQGIFLDGSNLNRTINNRK